MTAPRMRPGADSSRVSAVRFQRALLLALCILCAAPLAAGVVVEVPGIAVGIGPHYHRHHHRHHRHFRHHDFQQHDFRHD